MKVPRIVILGGAGAMGRIIALDLARTAGNSVEVVVADLGPRAKSAARTVTVDVRDGASLGRALRAASVVIASLPYRFNLDAMRGALAAGAHYIDLGGLFHTTRRQLALHKRFRAAGLTAILGMGSAPGILNVLAAHAASRMSVVREVHCMVGAVDSTRYVSSSPLGFGYSADTLLDELQEPSAVYRRGFAFVPPLDPKERREVRFPKPIGRVALDTTLHSEVATLPLHFRARGVREVTFRQSFDPAFVDRLVFLRRLGLTSTEPLAGLALRPRDVLHALLARLPREVVAGKPARHEILRALVRGERDGEPVEVTANCQAGPKAGWGVGPDIDTGAPPSIVAQMLLGGIIPPRRGVFAPESIVPVAPFLRELERRGMKVSASTRASR